MDLWTGLNWPVFTKLVVFVYVLFGNLRTKFQQYEFYIIQFVKLLIFSMT